MEFWQGFLLITSVHLLAAASPGPRLCLSIAADVGEKVDALV